MPLDRPFRLRLIHFNDLHGRLADVTPESVKPVFSRIAGFIRRARDEYAGRLDAGVLVLAAGDDLIGARVAELAGTRPDQFRCNPAYRLYARAGVDAWGIGNHDLDWGLHMLSLCATQDCGCRTARRMTGYARPRQSGGCVSAALGQPHPCSLGPILRHSAFGGHSG